MEKKVWLFLLVLFLCPLIGCSNMIQELTRPPDTENTTSSAELKMPDSISNLVENPNVRWMVGMLAVLDDVEMVRGISQDSFEVFTEPGDIIRATITAQNGLDLSQRFDLMIFADGVPMEFEVEGKLYRTYPMVLTKQQITVKLKLRKDFALNLGRLDFVISLAENKQIDSHLLSYTMWIDLKSEPLIPDALCSVVEQRTGVQQAYAGGAYNSWLWKEGYVPLETDFAGPRTISIQDKEKVLLEAIASKEGLYRTVLVVNGSPVDFEMDGSKYSYLDWESTGTNMLQLPITLIDVPSSGSLYTITTPLTKTELAQFIRASGKTELVADTED